MAVKIRLSRGGAKKRPFYRVVAADTRSPRDGRFLEKLGTYDPLHDDGRIELKRDRIEYWMSVGAQPTHSVARILRRFDAKRAG
jgi:small subunit ribosomal protein S16